MSEKNIDLYNHKSYTEIYQSTSSEQMIGTINDRHYQNEVKNMEEKDTVRTKELFPAIFKLNIDCFHEIFDWLELYDLISIGRTCKRLNQVAGVFYQMHYVSKRIIAENGGSHTLYRRLNIFAPYIEKISISGNKKVYDFIGRNCKSIREIRLGNNLSIDAIQCIKEILKNVEVIEMHECFFKQEFYDFVLKYCLKMKSLSVKRSNKIRNKTMIIGSNNDWLLQKYPMLEHIELTEIYELQKNELKTFFELNPNVGSFSTDSASLEENRHLLLSSRAKLDKLVIEFSSQYVSKELRDLLAQLQERRFYKRLHIYSIYKSQENLYEMISDPFSSSLEFLHIDIPRFLDVVNLDIVLKNLKILSIKNPNEILNTNTLTSKLPNLEKIYFGEANITEISPFIHFSPNLKTIKIRNMIHSDRIYFVSQFPYLLKMNEKRKQLAGARKVVIYICDRLMLASKWAKKMINLNLIELRRFESLEWNDLNSYCRHNHSKHYF